MPFSFPIALRLSSISIWIALGVLAPVAMVAISAMMLLDLRQDAWDRAGQTSANLLQVIESDIARNVEIIDLALQGVVENLNAPEIAAASPVGRKLMLFDRAITARDIGSLIVMDEHGDIVIDATAEPARTLNARGKDYFEIHRARTDQGLFITGARTSRLTGQRVLVLSRRIAKPDGSFGGIVLSTLRLSYFDGLFRKIGLGEKGSINLLHRDGTRITRHPAVDDGGANLAGVPIFERFLREGRGSFVARATLDGVERRYAFAQIGDLPLILSVALATDEIEADWRSKAVVIGLAVLALCGLIVCLALLFGRELRRRTKIEAELARLSLTDGLTGLPNRRHFEEAFGAMKDRAARARTPFALLVVDVDHFKRCNDRYGHQGGDQVLRRLADCLRMSIRYPADMACRVGGEEFALLLPDTDLEGAHRVADRVHAEVAGLSVREAGIKPGGVTVSIGLAVSSPEGPVAHRDDLYRRADAALYEAKRRGRNRTCFDRPPQDQDGVDATQSDRMAG